MDEGKIEFRKFGENDFDVFSDCWSGKLERVGYLHRETYGRRILWTATTKNHAKYKSFFVRKEAAKWLLTA